MNRKVSLLFFLPLLPLLTIVTYFILTTSINVRYWADDFCSATVLARYDFLGAQKFWWQTWSGRYSFYLLIHFFEALGPWVVRVIPIISLLFLSSSLLPVFSKITNNVKNNLVFGVVLSYLTIVLILINAPNIIQSFYWQTGVLTYAFPFIFLNLFLSILISKDRKSLLFVFLLLFIAGGFSESYAAAQAVFVFFILLILVASGQTKIASRRKIVIAGLLGTLASLILTTSAPGNQARSTTVTQPESLVFIIKSTLYGTKWWLQRMLLIKPFIYSLFLGGSIIYYLVSKHWQSFKRISLETRRVVMIIVLTLTVAVLSTAAVIASGYYSMSITPPERTMFITNYFIIFCFLIVCFLVSILINRYLSKKLRIKTIYFATLLYITSTIFLTKSTFLHWQSVKTQVEEYAREWDIQEKAIIQQKYEGEEKVVIKNVKPVGELDGFIENKGWVSSCATGYYKVEKIIVEN